jgi:hypothetical protein
MWPSFIDEDFEIGKLSLDIPLLEIVDHMQQGLQQIKKQKQKIKEMWDTKWSIEQQKMA